MITIWENGIDNELSLYIYEKYILSLLSIYQCDQNNSKETELFIE